jgi:hypothetical protein
MVEAGIEVAARAAIRGKLKLKLGYQSQFSMVINHPTSNLNNG